MEPFNIYCNTKNGTCKYLTQVNASSVQDAVDRFSNYFNNVAEDYIIEGFAKICEQPINLSDIFAKRDLEEKKIQEFQLSKFKNNGTQDSDLGSEDL